MIERVPQLESGTVDLRSKVNELVDAMNSMEGTNRVRDLTIRSMLGLPDDIILGAGDDND